MVHPPTPSSSLALAAPGFALLLETFLSPAEQAVIANDYAQVAEIGGNIETCVVREVGASFNPRTARVASLVIGEGEQKRLPVIRGALWSCSGAAPDDDPESQVRSILERVRRLDVSLPEPASIGVALSLDRVRHFHMTGLTDEEKMEYLTGILAGPYLSESCRATETLKHKLRHAISLQLRRLGWRDNEE